MEPNQNQELMALFSKAQADLINAQTELSALIASAAADPWLETQQEVQRERLTTQRDEMLQHWARIALSWMLRGGKLELVPPDGQGESQILSAPRPRPVTVPTVIAQRPVRPAAPVVQTIRRSRPDDFGRDSSPAPSSAASSTWRRPSPTISDLDAESLRDSLDVLTEPQALQTLDDVRQELEHLLQATTPQALMDWSSFPKTAQRSLVGLVVARARHVQDEVSPTIFPPDLSHDLDRIFSGMTAFSKREQPGFVFGLMRHHHPVGESWLSDARKWWQDLLHQLPEDIRPDPEGALSELQEMLEEEDPDDEEIIDQALAVLEDGLDAEDPRFVKLMTPYKHLLRQHTQFKRLRKAIREHDEDDPPTDDVDRSAVEE